MSLHPSRRLIQPPRHSPSAEAIATLRREVDRLQKLLHEANQELATYREKSFAQAPTTHHGRPVMSCAEAAKLGGVSLSTVSRYLKSGHWEGVEYKRHLWHVFADQPLAKKKRRVA